MSAFLRDAPLPLLPADVQQRADAELGAAWRRCEAAFAGAITLERLLRGKGYAAGVMGHRKYADTPAAALTALAEALEARKEADAD